MNLPRRKLGLLVASLVALSFSSCAELQQMLAAGNRLQVSPPKVVFQGATLVQSPSQQDLSAYFCPRLLRERVGFAPATDLLCSRFFGAAPRPEAMQIGFDLRFNVANPNQVPLPLASLLTALTVFPATTQSLGAVCLRLCAPGDTACAAGADPAACRNAPGDIRTIDDFPRAIANFLIAQGIAAAGGQPVGFALPQVVAGSSIDVVARLALTPEALLAALEPLARQSVEELKAGRRLTFTVPYKMEGTVFAEAGSLGRLAAGFGPLEGAWPLPTD